MNGKILKEWDIPLGKKGKSMTSKRKRKRKRIISESLGIENHINVHLMRGKMVHKNELSIWHQMDLS